MQLKINVTSGDIALNITLDPNSVSLQELFWDYNTATLYAAVASNTSELIVTVDTTSGAFSTPIGTGPSFDEWVITSVDVPNHTIFAIVPSAANQDMGLWAFDYTEGMSFLILWIVAIIVLPSFNLQSLSNACVCLGTAQFVDLLDDDALSPSAVFTWNY